MKLKGKAFWTYAGLCLSAVLFAGINLVLGRSEFGGYDLSVLIDGAWRVLNGQVPGTDFPCPFPPTFYLFGAWAFRAFGLNWMALLYAEDILFLLLTAAGLRLCWMLRREDHPENLSLAAIYVAAQSVPLLAVNHLWHSTTASAFAAYAVLACYVLLRLEGERVRQWEATLHLALAFTFLVLSKPNTAWPALLLCLFCLLWEKRTRIHALAALATGLVASTWILTLYHVSLHSMLAGYAAVSGRAKPKLFFAGIYPDPNWEVGLSVVAIYLAIGFPLALLSVLVWRERKTIWRSATDLLCLGAVFVTILGLGTNWDLKICDVLPLMVGMALLSGSSAERTAKLLRPVRIGAILLHCLALFLGTERTRMKGVGAWAGEAYGPKTTIRDPFFGTFDTRLAFDVLLGESDWVVKNLKGKQIFFGPRMEFLYAREGLASPKQLPLCWHPGTSYGQKDEPLVVQGWTAARFDVLIFAKRDYTRIPVPVVREILRDYVYDPRFQTIGVFYRKPENSDK